MVKEVVVSRRRLGSSLPAGGHDYTDRVLFDVPGRSGGRSRVIVVMVVVVINVDRRCGGWSCTV